MKRTRGDRAFRLVSLLLMLVLCLLVAFPMFMTVSVSLQTMNEIYACLLYTSPSPRDA